MERGLYRGLMTASAARAEEAAALNTIHNATVPADSEADACDCPACQRDPVPVLAIRLADIFGADRRKFLCDLEKPRAIVQAPPARGPLQDESGALDPVDAQAMLIIEGRTTETSEVRDAEGRA